ncbi:MAG: DNA cytosine methyltransferase [Bacteroidetes bacterium]|nr:MAG: DNA cytosine methyltransferase [Bacteroidota bacterium]MBL1145498.1 DNA cytosine methyltransferase [Bacteroidota bacterium]NOG58296.1 DNA cytosine methyltransferase [Bacteroidota bacterium]
MKKRIPIIDLFAGPGGLGEGFMSLKDKNGKSIFDIKLSIEKEENAHKTLTLRSFYRQFKKDNKTVPKAYYRALKQPDIAEREKQIEKLLNDYPEGKKAKSEARLIELGSKNWPPEIVDALIKERLKGEKNWVLIGGPPCQAYSSAGRVRVGGINKKDHRVYLYREYLRIIENHEPAIFVMENVKGLLSAKVDDEKVFDWMKKDLTVENKYTIHSFVKPVNKDIDYLIKSEKFGIPQKRHRVILFGIRKGLKHIGEYLNEKEEVQLQDVISDLPPLRSKLNRKFIKNHKTDLYSNGRPKKVYENLEDSSEGWKKLMNQNLKIIKSWGSLELNGLTKGFDKINLDLGSEFTSKLSSFKGNNKLKKWYLDKELNGVTNHDARGHLTQDLMRYLFSAIFVENNNEFPRIKDFAKQNKTLLPEHANVLSGKFVDRFKVQMRNKPASTVTCHISKDGHTFIHYDPTQCRTLTVREAARIQTFPDNYLFRGSRTAQYHQVGNAVPPFLALQIAEIVYKTVSENEII